MLHPKHKAANHWLHQCTHGGFEFILMPWSNISQSNDIDFDKQAGDGLCGGKASRVAEGSRTGKCGQTMIAGRGDKMALRTGTQCEDCIACREHRG